jgi:DNA-directed RNA polymerase subunit H
MWNLFGPLHNQKPTRGFSESMKKKFKTDKHFLIPKHSKLSDAQKEKLLERYNISVRELPRINKTDAAISSLAAKPGDVVKVTRRSETAGEAFFYRVVVDV